MPFYEFECARGHVTERLVKMDTKEIFCDVCLDGMPMDRNGKDPLPMREVAKRILSPTPTTFRFASGVKY